MIRMKVFLSDYGDNTSYYAFTYKIDKTAPELTLSSITEDTDYTYYGGRVNTTSLVEKNDSVSAGSNGDAFENPTLASYTGDTPAARQNHMRPHLNAFYFRDTIAGSGASSPFTLNVDHSDTYAGFLGATGTWSDGGSTDLTS